MKCNSLRNFSLTKNENQINSSQAEDGYHEMSLNAGLASNRQLREDKGQIDHLLYQIEEERRSLFDNILDLIKVKNNRK